MSGSTRRPLRALLAVAVVAAPLAVAGATAAEDVGLGSPTTVSSPPPTTSAPAPPETTEAAAPPETTEAAAPPETTVPPPETTEAPPPPPSRSSTTSTETAPVAGNLFVNTHGAPAGNANEPQVCAFQLSGSGYAAGVSVTVTVGPASGANPGPATYSGSATTTASGTFLVQGAGSLFATDGTDDGRYRATATVGSSTKTKNFTVDCAPLPDPSIDITKAAGLSRVASGTSVEFTITVVNDGNVELTGVVVEDPNTPACVDSIGDLAVDEEVEYTCSTGPLTEGFTNVAFVSGFVDEDDEDDEDCPCLTIPRRRGSGVVHDQRGRVDDHQDGYEQPGPGG